MVGWVRILTSTELAEVRLLLDAQVALWLFVGSRRLTRSWRGRMAAAACLLSVLVEEVDAVDRDRSLPVVAVC